MKLSTPLTTLLVAVSHCTIASGQAFSPVITVSGSAASASATSNALAGICPGYDGKNFTDGNSATYSVDCDAYATSEDEYLVTNPSSVATAVQCMNACDEFDGCEGAVYYPGSRCVLTLGTTFGWQQNSSGVAYFIRQGAQATVSSAAPISSSVTLSTLSIAVSSLTTSASAVPTSAQACNSSNIQCPACDGETVTDYNGTAYQVYCNCKLNSSSVYDVQAYTSASGCLLHCDDYTWCLGATFWTGGNCQLVKGSPSPTQEAGFTAFLPVDGAFQTASPSLVVASSKAITTSAASRPGGTLIPDGPRSTSYTAATGTTETPSAFSSVSTNAASLSASCPASDGLNVTDVVAQNYTVTCDYEPVCEIMVNGTNASYTQETCLESCDQDAVCLAATWNNGSCVLCEGSIDSLADYEAGSGDVVFLSRAVADELNQPVSAISAGSAGPATSAASSSLLQPTPSATGQSVVSADAPTSSIRSASSVGKPLTAPGIYVPPSSAASTSTSAISSASTGPIPVSTTLTTFASAAASSISTIPASFYSTSAPLSSGATSADDAYYGSASTIPTASSVRQDQTFITAPSPSSTKAITMSSSFPSPSISTSKSSSSSFVPPLTSGSVSYATPGGETRVAVAATSARA
ncbi:hypothetical protein EJ03DRAFT_101018 [Teratosphaeria nubilosa]|uniref:Apple domain-containing protein n=1 Tax=Teratosphaeria nubilosa TaxID=161662 RepID=A0A6G1LLT5_9PEZI|nr:hypothetical protein EJ03DRAFT_101018 [Teratosphaeria nubilosa]